MQNSAADSCLRRIFGLVAGVIELELQQRGVSFTATKLELPEDLPQQDWAEIGRQLLRADQMMQWWIGDWAAFGDKKFGALKEFCEINGFNYGTAKNLGWVARSIHLSLRRDHLQFSYYPEVAALKPKDQKRFLELAESKRLAVSELRREIRQSFGTHNALESDGPVMRFAVKLCDDLLGWLQTRGEEFWNPDRRAIWKARLAPIVKFAEGL